MNVQKAPLALAPPSEAQQLNIILLITFIGFVGISIPYPIFAPLFLHPAHGGIIPATWPSYSRSILLGTTLAAYPLAQFIGSPVLGSLSDQYGRKNLLLLSIAGTCVGYLLSALALIFNMLWLLILSRFITGLMESNIAIARAIAADFTKISRYKSFGRINSTASIGYALGPLLGGFLADSHLVSWFSLPLPFFLGTVLAGLTLIPVWKKLTQTNVHIVAAAERTALLQQFRLLHQLRLLLRGRTSLKYLLLISSLLTLSVDIFYEFGPAFLTGRWLAGPAQIAVYTLVLSVAMAFSSGWLVHRLSSLFSMSRVIQFATLATIILLLAIISAGSQAFLMVLFGLIGITIALACTSVTVEISDQASAAIQGKVLGTQFGLRTLGDAVLCLIGGVLLVQSVALPLVISSLFALASLSLYVVWSHHKTPQQAGESRTGQGG